MEGGAAAAMMEAKTGEGRGGTRRLSKSFSAADLGLLSETNRAKYGLQEEVIKGVEKPSIFLSPSVGKSGQAKDPLPPLSIASGVAETGDLPAAINAALGDARFLITDLNISANRIGDEGLSAIANHLLLERCTLTSLDLSGNAVLGETGVADLCKALEQGSARTMLTKLDLNENKLGPKSVRVDDEFLSFSPSILLHHCLC